MENIVKWRMAKGVVLVLAVLAIGAVANGALLSQYEFEGTWDNSVSGGLAVLPQGGAALATDPCDGRNAAKITGSTSWLQVGYDTVFDANKGGISTQMTIAGWFRSTSKGTSLQRLMGRGYSWYLNMNETSGDGKATIVVRDSANSGTPIKLTGNTVIRDGAWHHIAATWDTATGALKLYVDGHLDASATHVATSIQQDSRYAIGGRATSSTDGAQIFTGRVDDVRVYNNALTEMEIRAINPLDGYVPGPNVPGPNVPGPNVPYPNVP